LGDATGEPTRARWHQSANIERVLPAGQGREVVHPDGSLTRVDDAASTSLGASDPPMPEDGSDGVVRLERGQLWHEADPASPPGQRFDVHLPRIRVMSKDGTFAVMVEHDGSSFVTAIAGDVAVVGDDDVAVHIAPLDAALMSPEGLIVDAILSTADELQRDSWIGPNLRLSAIDAGNVRLPSETPRFEPRPAPVATAAPPAGAPEVAEPVAEAPAEEAPVLEATPAVEEAPVAEAAVVEPPVEIAEPLRVSADEAPAAATVVEGEAPAVEERPAGHATSERGFTWDWGTPSTSGAATIAAEPAVEATEPELVVPAEVLEGRDRSGVVEEAELEEEEPASPARAMVAAALVLVGLIIVVIAIRGLLHSESPQDVTPSQATSTVPEGSSGSTASTTGSGGTTGTTAKGGSTTTAKSATAARYTVHPTRCAQSGNQLTAEGTITNLDTTNHSYRIRVIFTTDGTNQAATASADVSKAQPNKPAPWTMSTSYSGDLSKSGGCRVGSVDIIS
jgi:hypothetical protein